MFEHSKMNCLLSPFRVLDLTDKKGYFCSKIRGAGAMRLATWVQENNISVGWYVWLMAALSLLLGTLTVQHFFASHKELEPKAAWMGVLVMGLPALILAGVVLFLICSLTPNFPERAYIGQAREV